MKKQNLTIIWDFGIDSKGRYVTAVVYDGSYKVGSYTHDKVLSRYARSITKKQTINIAKKEILNQVKKRYPTYNIIERYTPLAHRMLGPR